MQSQIMILFVCGAVKYVLYDELNFGKALVLISCVESIKNLKNQI